MRSLIYFYYDVAQNFMLDAEKLNQNTFYRTYSFDGTGSAASPFFKVSGHCRLIDVKYSSSSAIRLPLGIIKLSFLYTSTSSGIPTDTLERKVDANEMSEQRRASSSGIS